MTDMNSAPRPDDSQLCSALKKCRNHPPTGEGFVEPPESEVSSIDHKRQQIRKLLLAPESADPNGWERIIRRSDLCAITYLSQGVRVSRAVGRIRVSDDAGVAMATGFLVAPNLLLTNHHVLRNAKSASMALLEMNYESDLNGVETPRYTYNFVPSQLFLTSADMDFTLIEVAPRSREGMPLADFGYLPLLRQSGKALPGEYLSIIQHPGGQPKQIAIRDSEVLKPDSHDVKGVDLNIFIHYSTDTEPGSSGAPVLNDQWQVVALHHRGVPDLDANGRRLNRNGDLWKPEMGADELGWAANEGVRVSAICQFLSDERFTSSMHFDAFQRVRFGQSLPQGNGRFETVNETESTNPVSSPNSLDGRNGYNPDFLSIHVPVPTVTKRLGQIAKLKDSEETQLRYTNFSVVFDSKRRVARFTAVNIDGAKFKSSETEATWRRDGRIEEKIQPNDDFYKKGNIPEVVYFERGHLVRRIDPAWGPKAVQAIKDTFHFTNAAPHTKAFNNTIWGNLEDYLLAKCILGKKKMSVFSGPILRSSDPKTYGMKRPGGPYRIPVDYWKVAVLQKTPTEVVAAAFIVGQQEHLNDLEAARSIPGFRPYTPEELIERAIQTRIEEVESLTDLDFGFLRDIQTTVGLESTGSFRVLTDGSQILV